MLTGLSSTGASLVMTLSACKMRTGVANPEGVRGGNFWARFPAAVLSPGQISASPGCPMGCMRVAARPSNFDGPFFKFSGQSAPANKSSNISAHSFTKQSMSPMSASIPAGTTTCAPPATTDQTRDSPPHRRAPATAECEGRFLMTNGTVPGNVSRREEVHDG